MKEKIQKKIKEKLETNPYTVHFIENIKDTKKKSKEFQTLEDAKDFFYKKNAYLVFITNKNGKVLKSSLFGKHVENSHVEDKMKNKQF